MVIPPSREDLKRFYTASANLRGKTFFLVLANSGLRNHEAAGLRIKDIDLETGMIIPNRGELKVNSTKNTFVTFLNQEALRVLKGYLSSLDKLERENWVFRKGFGRSGITYRWKRTAKKSGVKLTPQEVTELIPDRYIDAFCVRVPKTILARHYTDYSPKRLKRIYGKAGLKVLN